MKRGEKQSCRLLSVLWTCIFVSLVFASMLNAQEPLKFKSFSKDDGLSQASVFAIVQDLDGFLWVGTRDGLNRWDGKEFRLFKHTDSPQSLICNDVRSLFVDEELSGIWVGTLEGLSFLDTKKEAFESFIHDAAIDESISNNIIRCVFREDENKLWIGTANGLNLYNSETNSFTRFLYQEKVLAQSQRINVTSLTISSQGKLLVGTDKGLFVKDKDNQFAIVKLESSTDKLDITSLVIDEKFNLWIGTAESGLMYYSDQFELIKSFETEKNNLKSLSNNNIRTICRDKENNLWVGTFDGLNKYNSSSNEFDRFQVSSSDKFGLSDSSIRSLFFDAKGNLWIGTYYGGINHLDESYNQFQNFTFSPNSYGLSAGVISSFEEDGNSNIWVGTEGGGLNYWDSKANKFTQVAQQESGNAISGNNIKSLLLDDDDLWVGIFSEGLNKLNTKTNKIERWKYDSQNQQSLSNNNVYSLLKEQERLWIATYGGGLDILDTKTGKIINFQSSTNDTQSISSDLLRVIRKSSDNQIWIGTEKGLNKVEVDASGYPIGFQVLLEDDKIYALQECSSKLFIGTISNGLYTYDLVSKKVKHYTKADGLPGNTIFGVLEDDGKIWISTNNGLSRMDLSTETFTNFNQSNGLSNVEYNFNAYYKLSNGEMLFGGLNGFTKFHSRDIKPNDFIPKIAFTKLKHNNVLVPIEKGGIIEKSLNETIDLQFEFNKANFSIAFAALDFSSPDQNHFSYKLEGLDKDWKYTVGESEATYTIQRDGSYTFRLRGGNSDGTWNPEERQLNIIVLPPLWRTWWAYLIYLSILLLSLFGLYRFLHLRNALKLKEIEKEQQGRLNEMKLRFFTNITHEFRTPLTLIMGPLKQLLEVKDQPAESKHKLALVERNAQRLLNLVNQVLTFRKLATDHDPVNPKLNDITHFVQEIYLSFLYSAKEKNITIELIKPAHEVMLWFDEEKMEKVFFNLLSNALKFTPQGGEIVIDIQQHAEHVEIGVSDTGTGISEEHKDQVFKRFYEKSNNLHSSIKGTGIGLAISKQMIELHNGSISVDSNVGEGARFKIILPHGKEHFKAIAASAKIDQTIFSEKPILINESLDGLDELISSIDHIDKEKKTLLIVEDNQEVREYICHIFQQEFNIHTAINGKDGLKKIKRFKPELIVSDVMMPIMNGIEMCAALKKDLEISHIPIILLTARTASLFKIEGLKIGADDYVTKPFNPEELRLRVHNLIKIKQEAKEKFAKVLTIDAKEIPITSTDQIFIEKAMGIVEKHMSDSDFNIEQFASEMMISRALLFSKIKSLTDQTPNNFIKTIRIKRAAQLLINGKMYVSEVAYKVGFKDSKYFSKCFRKQFDLSPSAFVEKHNESRNKA